MLLQHLVQIVALSSAGCIDGVASGAVAKPRAGDQDPPPDRKQNLAVSILQGGSGELLGPEETAFGFKSGSAYVLISRLLISLSTKFPWCR